jgi:Branched-chain amino acid transport system / permease component
LLSRIRIQPGVDLRHRHVGAQYPDRLQWPDFVGQGAFYGIGAYTTAILLDKTAIAYWAAVPIADAICLGAGFLFGLPALRLKGLDLALATLALVVATPQILKFKSFDYWTSGVQGIQVDPPGTPFGLPLNHRPVDPLFLPDLDDRVGRHRAQFAARTHRSRDGRDPRPSSSDGRRHRALQVAEPLASVQFTPVLPALGRVEILNPGRDDLWAFRGREGLL